MLPVRIYKQNILFHEEKLIRIWLSTTFIGPWEYTCIGNLTMVVFLGAMSQ